MDRLRTLARIAAWSSGFLAYLWVAGVHYAEEARRRKAARRRGYPV